MMSDAFVLASAMALLSFVKCFPVSILSRRLLRRSGLKMGLLKSIKFRMALWKALYYSSAAAYAICVLAREPWILDPVQYQSVCTAVPARFKTYYLVSLAYYINEFITIFIEPRKKDFAEMLIHHVATIILITLSYQKGLVRYGLAILAIHDLADPWLEIAKSSLALRNYPAANACFFVFMVIFIVSRIGIYPYFIVRPATLYLFRHRLQFWNCAIALMLNVLVATHIVWSYFIIRVFMKILRNERPGDARSEEEEVPK